ncbi:MAG: TonB family protein [Candidatus Krumholzibacteriia bacterium]
MIRRGLWLGLLVAVAMAGRLPATEVPPPDGPWRAYRLQRCDHPAPPPPAVRAILDEARELFDLQNGGDAVVVLEDGLRREPTSAWIRLFLAQIYILAGQGEPHCLPSGGPAAPRGDWPADRRRCLERADRLLGQLAATWPDDGIVWFLRADAARALDDPEAASEDDLQGRRCCTRLESLEFIADLRDLQRKPGELITPIAPEYPEACLRKRITGRVELDLLVDPEGRVAESVALGRADRRLQAAAAEAARDAGFQAARVGYYPIWSWIRVSVNFTLEN